MIDTVSAGETAVKINTDLNVPLLMVEHYFLIDTSATMAAHIETVMERIVELTDMYSNMDSKFAVVSTRLKWYAAMQPATWQSKAKRKQNWVWEPLQISQETLTMSRHLWVVLQQLPVVNQWGERVVWDRAVQLEKHFGTLERGNVLSTFAIGQDISIQLQLSTKLSPSNRWQHALRNRKIVAISVDTGA